MEHEIKRLEAFEIKDAEAGTVEAVVATLNVVDRDRDVILASAIRSDTRVKISHYDHSIITMGEAPVGKGSLSVQGDKVIMTGQYFLGTTKGRDAFEMVRSLGQDSEWSIAFNQVKSGELTADQRNEGARRVIEEMNIVEVSPVLMGAGINTRTLATKAHRESVKAAASLTYRIDAVQTALSAWSDENGDYENWWWAREVFEDHVIAGMGGKLFRVAYTVGEDGSVTLGESVEVEIIYQVVKAATDDLATKAAELAAQQATTDLQTRAQDEFDRFQRTRRILRLA